MYSGLENLTDDERLKIKLSKAVNIFDRVIFFPGSKSEYESLRGYPVDIIDTGVRDKSICITYFKDEKTDKYTTFVSNADIRTLNETHEFMVNLAKSNIEAIINVIYHGGNDLSVRGLPVRKKAH